MNNTGTTQSDPQTNTPKPDPKIIPDVEVGLGAGARENNLTDVDPNRHEKLPGQDQTPAGKEERLPGKEERLQ